MAQTIVSSPFTDNRMTLTVSHTSHGFDANDIGKAVRSSGTDGQFVVARANTAANAEVVGVITSIDTANQYTITTSGFVDVVAAVPTATAGTVYFLAEAADSQLTSTEPTTTGAVSKPVAVITESNAKMILIHYRGEVITTGTDTKAPNDAQYVTLATSSGLSAERTLAAGSGITLTDAGANGAATISIANDAIDSQHYNAGSIDLEHMSSQSVDEDNLHISNAGNDGEFLSKQSGNAGGLTWAAAGGSVNSKVQPFSRTASAGAGAQAFTNAGFTPTAIMVFAVESTGSYDCASWGFGDVAGGEGCFEVRDLKGTGAQASSRTGNLIFIGDGTNVMAAVLTSLDSAGCTITWTKTVDGLDVAGHILYLR